VQVTAGSSDIFLRRFNPHGMALGEPIRVNLATGLAHFNPSVSVSASGQFVVVWQRGIGEEGNVLARVFDEHGTVGDEILVTDQFPDESQMPSLATMADGGFTVAWSVSRSNGWGIDARRFDGHGAPLDDSFEVMAPGPYAAFVPQVASTPDGRTVVAWQTWGPNHSAILAQRYDANGQRAGDPLLVDPSPPGGVGLNKPSTDPLDVAIDATGNFVIAWATARQQDDRIRARQFDPAGEPLGPSFDVANADLANSVSVVVDAAGQFTIVWNVDSSPGVYARRFDASGQALDPAFPISMPGSAYPQAPVIAGEPDGDFVVTWSDYAESQPTQRVYFRRFEIIDQTPPMVIESAFEFETAQSIRVRFTENVASSLAASDLVVTNLTAGQMISTDNIQAGTYDFDTNAITFRFATNSLPDGNYSATFVSSLIEDQSGHPLAADYDLDFFVLAGDADHDRDVDVTDLGILASNWQKFVLDFTRGDFNYSGRVDVADLGILAARWQTHLAPPTARPSIVRIRVPRLIDQAALLS
jgi:hypothetical protein